MYQMKTSTGTTTTTTIAIGDGNSGAMHTSIPTPSQAMMSSIIDKKYIFPCHIDTQTLQSPATQLKCDSCRDDYKIGDLLLYPLPPDGRWHVICSEYCHRICRRCGVSTVVNHYHEGTKQCLFCQFDPKPVKSKPISLSTTNNIPQTASIGGWLRSSNAKTKN